MAAPTDAELLPRLLAGEQRAFRELVGAYRGAMRAVGLGDHRQIAYRGSGAGRLARGRFAGWTGFQGRSSLKTWLLTITANTAKSRLPGSPGSFFLDDLPRPMVRWMTSALPPTVTGASRHAWHEDSPKPCSPRANCAIAGQDPQRSVRAAAQRADPAQNARAWSWEEIRDLLDITLPIRVLLHRARLKVFATLEHFEETGQC